MIQADIIIKNGIVLTMDKNRSIIDDGAVVITGDKITVIGPTREIEKSYTAPKVIEARKRLVLPGFVDTHNHCDGTTLANGLAFDLTLAESYDHIFSHFSFGPDVEPRHNELGAQLACLMSIKTGTTCIANNHAAHSNEIAGAFKESGLRSVLSQSIKDLWPSETRPGHMPDRHQVMDETVAFIETWDGAADGRIRTCFGPITEFTVSEAFFKDIVAMADKMNKGIHVHLAETSGVVSDIKREKGKRSIEYAYDLGLLRPGTVVGHGCWLSPKEISLLAKSGAAISHTPVSEMSLSDGVTPVPQLIEAGVVTSLGRDTHFDMIREMYTAAMLHKIGYLLDPELLKAEHVLEMATINGAKALLWDDEIGSLEKGKKADIILVNMEKPHLTPLLRQPKFTGINLLVYRASGEDVETVIVDGNLLMENRVVLTMDEQRVTREVEEAAVNLIDRTGLKNRHMPLCWNG